MREILAKLLAVVLSIEVTACSRGEPAGPEDAESVAQGSHPDMIRFLTYNIEHGARSKNELRDIAEFIRKQNAHVVALQEVDYEANRSYCVDQADLLASRAKYTEWHYAVSKHFGTACKAQGSMGNALLSRYPIISTAEVPLPSPGSEPRTLLLARLDIGGAVLAVGVAHLASRDGAVRAQQLDTIQQAFQALSSEEMKKGGAVLLGDFNESLDTGSISGKLKDNGWFDAWNALEKTSAPYTLCSDKKVCDVDHPNTRADGVFFRGGITSEMSKGRISVRSFRRSDHRAVAATVPRPATWSAHACDNDCPSCAATSCAVHLADCKSEPDCGEAETCATQCNGDGTCVLGCAEKHPTGWSRFYALDTCKRAACAERCFCEPPTTCGLADGPYLRSNDDCGVCQSEHCCAQGITCAESVACYEAAQCSLACLVSGTGCPPDGAAACMAMPGFASWQALLACSVQNCADVCH